MDLKRIIMWKYKGKRPDTNGKEGRAVAAFFVVMVVFTLLSRAAANIITPIVSTDQVQRGSLTWKIQASGTTVENQVKAVFTTADIRIKQVMVGEGASVMAGEGLFLLDQEDLSEKIESKELEIEKARLRIADLALQRELSQEQKCLIQKRAQEDLERIRNDTEERVQNAYTEILEIEDGMQHYSGDGEAMKELLELYEQAGQEYRDALREQEEQIVTAERNLEDAYAGVVSDSTEKIMLLDMEILKKELEELKKLSEEGGVIASPIDGTVKHIGVEAGGFTTDGAAVSIADQAAGSIFIARLPEEQKKYIEAGDEVVLEPYGGSKITDLTVDNIMKDKENEGMFFVSVRIPAGQLEIGKSATMVLEKKSSVYESTIPLSALREDDKGYYVLVVQETKTVLGVELTAERMDITVQEKNDTAAALADGIISHQQPVIVNADKPVGAKDRVRLGETG